MCLAIRVKETLLINGKVCANIASGWADRVAACILALSSILVQTRLPLYSVSVCFSASGGTSAWVFVSVAAIAMSLSAAVSVAAAVAVIILLAVGAGAIFVLVIPVSAVRVAPFVVQSVVSVAWGTILVPRVPAFVIALVPVLTVGVGLTPISTVAIVVVVLAFFVVIVVFALSWVVTHDGWKDGWMSKKEWMGDEREREKERERERDRERVKERKSTTGGGKRRAS